MSMCVLIGPTEDHLLFSNDVQQAQMYQIKPLDTLACLVML